MKNLSRKYKKGTYDPVLAAKLWKYWVDEAVKDYNKEILGGGRSLRQNVFTMQDRKQAAIELEEQWRDDVRTGEYLLLTNPKGRKKMAKKKRSKKQLANDKRLGRMAKARAKKKYGGKVAKRKRAAGRKKYTRTKRVAKTRRNPKRKTPIFAHRMWNIFKCRGNSVHFLALNTEGKIRWTLTRGDTVTWKMKSIAEKVAKKLAGNRKYSNFQIGLANQNQSVPQIAAACKKGK
jgi:hypothetical protein